MRLMMLVSTFEFRRALAPEARRQHVETSVERKPSSAPRKVTAWRSVAVMSLGQTETLLNRLDPIWRRVFLFPCSDHSSQGKVNIASGVQSWVLGPHCKERLGNMP